MVLKIKQNMGRVGYGYGYGYGYGPYSNGYHDDGLNHFIKS
jgi:hypothetical protein